MGRQIMAGFCAGGLLFSTAIGAEDGWGGEVEAYGWLPIIEFQAVNGEKAKVTRDDILSDLDKTTMFAARLHKGKWSASSDVIYFKISDKENLGLLPRVPSLATLREAGLQAWVVRPNISYMLFNSDGQKIELYAGTRYIWIEVDATLDFDPVLPGRPSTSRKESPSFSNWDAVAGVRGKYTINNKWFVPYSANAGKGESDSTWEVQSAIGYKLNGFDAIAGWRYLYYDFGPNADLRKLDVSGPFVGVLFHW